eukprot:m.308189 g.308189  ORF g.308189 m.308189 type:complete len:191 (-) comp16472_c0_seq27:178-750(-)
MMSEPEEQSATLHLLKLEGEPGNGLNIGVADGEFGEYKWEGEVENEKPHGHGRATNLSGIYQGLILYGELRHGKFWGNMVEKEPNGRMVIFYYEEGNYLGQKMYESNDVNHKAIVDKAEQKAALARALVCVPWSRTTNHFLKWKPMQDLILTVLLVAERLHHKHTGTRKCSLRALPVEIWEMILKVVLAT